MPTSYYQYLTALKLLQHGHLLSTQLLGVTVHQYQ